MTAKLHIYISGTGLINKLHAGKRRNIQILKPEQNENEFISYLNLRRCASSLESYDTYYQFYLNWKPTLPLIRKVVCSSFELILPL